MINFTKWFLCVVLFCCAAFFVFASAVVAFYSFVKAILLLMFALFLSTASALIARTLF